MNHDQTHTSWRGCSTLFRALRVGDGQASDLQPSPFLPENLLPEQGSGKSLQRAVRLSGMDRLASQWWLGQPPRLGLLVRQPPRFQGSAVEEVGLMEFRFQPNLFEGGHVSWKSGPISIQTRCRRQRTATPVHDAVASIDRRGFAGWLNP